MTHFATYVCRQTAETSRPAGEIAFAGHSYPYFSQVREALASALRDYPALPPRQASFDDYLRVHTPGYLDALRQMAAGEQPAQPPRLSIECQGLEYCLPGYLYGLGGMLEAIDDMRAGTLERAYCFSLGGHHAYADRGHGYCLLNPQAAAARYAQVHGFARVLIVDWDVHHGNGTQAIFAHDASVYCISIHSVADLYMALAGHAAGHDDGGRGRRPLYIPVLDRRFDERFFAEMGLDRFYRAPEVAGLPPHTPVYPGRRI
jgi:acetoin utilization deacetylase AcuC-like enzyme